MNNREFWAQRWEEEQRAFRKVLAAVPTDKLDYCPHERSTKAGDLAWQLAQEQRNLVDLLDTGETSYVPNPRPPFEEILAAWDSATEDVRRSIASGDASKWEQPATFKVGGETAWADTLQNLMWGFLFDMVHHRGQLSSYLRPMGGKVPAIYGPSGDDRG
jgi:uncharacterized damage-inducible protein DinB